MFSISSRLFVHEEKLKRYLKLYFVWQEMSSLVPFLYAAFSFRIPSSYTVDVSFLPFKIKTDDHKPIRTLFVWNLELLSPLKINRAHSFRHTYGFRSECQARAALTSFQAGAEHLNDVHVISLLQVRGWPGPEGVLDFCESQQGQRPTGFFPGSCQVGTASFGWQRDTPSCEVACEWQGLPLEGILNANPLLWLLKPVGPDFAMVREL